MSASNCTKVYNSTRATATYSIGFEWSPYLDTEQVWDAFVLQALLEDHAARNMTLHLPHDGTQERHLREAMQTRNIRMQREGLLHVRHWCLKCTRIFDKRPDGNGISTYLIHATHHAIVG